MKKLLISLFVLAATLIISGAATAQMSIGGEVVDVIDGKTVVIAGPTGRVTAELQFIDVPEPSQPLNSMVREHLVALVLGKRVNYRAQTLYKDRTVGKLVLNDTDVSLQMLRDGAAWHVPLNISGQEQTEFEVYASTEAAAKTEKRGVWSIADLKPAWIVRSEDLALANRPTPSLPSDANVSRSKVPANRGYWSDKNPSLGDVGALANGYNAATKTGYVGTTFLGVVEDDPAKVSEAKTAIDFTYIYSESASGKRKGIYIATIISESARWRFLENNDLVIICDDKKTTVGKAKRTTESNNGTVRETLTYKIDPAALDRFVNGNDVMLKVGSYVIRPKAGLQMLLYNLLHVTS